MAELRQTRIGTMVQVAASDVVRASDVVHLVNAVPASSRRGPGLRTAIRIRIFYRSLS
jgi:hypothetical protein